MSSRLSGAELGGTRAASNDAGLKHSPEELRRVLRELMDLNMALADFGDRVAARLRVTRRDLVALTALAEVGAMTAGRIGDLLGLTSGAATGVINRLEAAGHATREVNPKDARSIVVKPTPEGRAALDRLWDEAARALDPGMPPPGGADMGVMAGCLHTATKALKEGESRLH